MNLAKQAGAAFEEGRFAESAALYEQLIQRMPQLASAYLPNLRRAQAKLGESAPTKSGATIQTLLDIVSDRVAGIEFIPPPEAQPLVSVVMTSHNTAQYVEDAVTSLMRQSWRNLEVIVVDDASSDATWQVLTRIQAVNTRIKVRRLNTNLGTYFAKNHGIQQAKGEFIFFQDSDDLSHPDRIALCMRALMRPQTIAVRSCYSRVAFPEGVVYPVNDTFYRLGLITLGVRRAAFNDIGYFNCTSKASDEEFLDRLTLLAQHQQKNIDSIQLPLYFNTLREGSLFADMVTNDPEQSGTIQQKPSVSRAAYQEQYRAVHQRLATPQQLQQHFNFPSIRDKVPVLPDMSKLPNPADRVVVGISSIPQRESALRLALLSLVHQADEIHVYLDGYPQVPAFLSELHPAPVVHRSQTSGSLRDLGKFLALQTLDQAAYVFTADDDIVYPPDYVACLIRKIDSYQKKAAVGLHGVLIAEQPTGYFSGHRTVFHYRRALESDKAVNLLGTGALAFHSSLFAETPFKPNHPGMADIDFAIACKVNRTPLICVARHDGWLQDIAIASGTTLYEEFKRNDRQHTTLLQQNTPWGGVAIQQALKAHANTSNDCPFTSVLHSNPLAAAAFR
jgi:hypothetical protein